MGVSPQYVGKYGKPWTINLNTDSGADNLGSITANAISIVIRDTSANTETASTGTIIINTANPAQISWQPTASDYATAGSYEARVNVTFSGAPAPTEYDPIPFVILPA